MFVLDMVHVLMSINASVTKDGWESIARSLIASVSLPICLIEFVLAEASVSNLMNVIATLDTEGTTVKELNQRNHVNIITRFMKFMSPEPQLLAHSAISYISLRTYISADSRF